MSVEHEQEHEQENEQDHRQALSQRVNWRARGQTARYIHPTEPVYRDQQAMRAVSILTQDAMMGFNDIDNFAYELSGRNPHSAPYFAEFQLDYVYKAKKIINRAVDRMA